MTTIVITGSTRGIGFGMATEFLKLGTKVFINGRSQKAVDDAIAKLSSLAPAGFLGGHACDVTDIEQIQSLWDAARVAFGDIDIWINNAGLANPSLPFWEQDPQLIKNIVSVNLTGLLFASHVVLNGMLKQNHGALYNMEGFGSNGRTMLGMTIYGSTKYAVRYVNQSLVEETKETPIIIGALSPGMVLTDLLTADRDVNPERWERSKKAFNILADRVETVTPFLAKKVLENQKSGARIEWLSTPKIVYRFLTARFNRRDLFSDSE